jgi:hypothetical protein
MDLTGHRVLTANDHPAPDDHPAPRSQAEWHSGVRALVRVMAVGH